MTMNVNYFSPKFVPQNEYCEGVTSHQCKMCENYSPNCRNQKNINRIKKYLEDNNFSFSYTTIENCFIIKYEGEAEN